MNYILVSYRCFSDPFYKLWALGLVVYKDIRTRIVEYNTFKLEVTMKVKELLEKLSKLNPEKELFCFTDRGDRFNDVE